MRQEVMDYVTSVLDAGDVAGKRVLEVGSYDVNGSVRPFIESLHPASYLGVDMREGPRVDQVLRAEDFQFDRDFELVISTEALEHMQDWRTCLRKMMEAVTEAGILLVTTVSPGFPQHDFPGDYWRYSVTDMSRILIEAQLPGVVNGNTDAQATFFKAWRPGGWIFPLNAWTNIQLPGPGPLPI